MRPEKGVGKATLSMARRFQDEVSYILSGGAGLDGITIGTLLTAAFKPA